MVTTKTYTFSNVTAGHTIQAEFTNMVDVLIKMNAGSPSACKIRYAVADTDVTPSTGWTTINTPTVSGTAITVQQGKYVHVEAIDITTGYSFAQWAILDVDADEQDDVTVNPTSYLMANTTYEFELTLTATTYSIQASCQNGGSMSYTTSGGQSGTVPAGQTRSVQVPQGGSATFTVTAGTGYRIKRILVDGSPISLE